MLESVKSYHAVALRIAPSKGFGDLERVVSKVIFSQGQFWSGGGVIYLLVIPRDPIRLSLFSHVDVQCNMFQLGLIGALSFYGTSSTYIRAYPRIYWLWKFLWTVTPPRSTSNTYISVLLAYYGVKYYYQMTFFGKVSKSIWKFWFLRSVWIPSVPPSTPSDWSVIISILRNFWTVRWLFCC